MSIRVSSFASWLKRVGQMRAFPAITLCALAYLFFFYGLGRLPLLGPDEPRYAQVAREMFITGDWITPRLAGIHWFEKPALTYWLSALGFTLLGVNELAARLPVALCATLCVLLLYWFGARVQTPLYGFLSALVLLSSGLWIGFARGATFDMPLAVSLAGALCSFYLWDASEARKTHYWWAFCALLGVAVLAKGLVGIILPLGICGAYLLLTRRWRNALHWQRLLGGAALFLLVAATWYAPMLARHGRAFIDEFFIGHHFQRYTSNKYKHPQPIYFFALVVLAGSIPWTGFLLLGLTRLRRAILADRWRLFLWLWVLVPLGFFSLSGSKLPGYILPVFPALALLIGLELDALWTAPTAALRRAGLVSASLLLLLAAAAFWFSRQQHPQLAHHFSPYALLAFGSLLGCVALGYCAFLLAQRERWATLFLPLGLSALLVLSAHLLFPALSRRESQREFLALVKSLAFPQERMLFYINSDHSADFYATEMPLRDAKSELVLVFTPAEIEAQFQAQGVNSLLILTPQRWADSVVKFYEPLGRLDEPKGDGRIYLCSPGCEWVFLRVWRRKPNL